MTETAFDAETWVAHLGEALDAFALTAEYSITIGPGETPWLTYEEFRALGESASHRPGMHVKSEPLIVRSRSDSSEQRSLLLEHPILRRAVNGPDGNESIRVLNPNGSLSIDMKGLVSSMTGYTVRTTGARAAKLLHRYLTEGEDHQLPAREYVVIYGLKMTERINLSAGAFLTPLDDLLISEEGFSEEEVDRLRTLGTRGRSFRDGSGGSSVFVRDLVWGPGVAQGPGTEHADTPDVQYLYSCDHEIVIDLLSIAARCPVVTTARHTRVASWMHDINPNFTYGSWSGGGFIGDGWWKERELTERDTAVFQEASAGWCGFQHAHEGHRDALRLAIGRIARSYSRADRMRLPDMIFDYAVALEILYQLDRSELTYKLGTRAAYLLKKEPEDRLEVFKKITEFYKIRSGIVHGRTKKLCLEDFERACAVGQDLACDTLVALLRAGDFPDWTSLVVEGGDSFASGDTGSDEVLED